MPFSNSKNFFKNVIFNFIRQVGVGLLNLFITILIARFFGAEINGLYTLAILFPILLMTFLNMGLSASNVYFISSKKISLDDALRLNKRLFIKVSLVGLILGLIITFTLTDLLFPGLNKSILIISLILYPMVLLYGYMLSIFQALQDFKNYNVLLILQPVIFLILVSTFVITNHIELVNLIISFIISYIIALIYISFKLNSIRKIYSVKSTTVSEKEIINYGIKSNISNIVSFLNYKIDIFLVNIFINPTATGIYIIAIVLVEKIWLISSAISTVLLPRLSELSSNKGERKKITPYVSRIVMFITLIIGLILALISEQLIFLIFGSEYEGAFEALLILLPGVIILSSAKILANDIAAMGKPEINMYISIITLIVNVIGNLILIPKLGINGGALATTISYLICSIFTLIIYSKLVKTKLTDSIFIKTNDIKLIINIFMKRGI